MSCSTFKATVGIPIFGLAFTSSKQLVMGGGGGAGRSGVKNRLSSYKVDVRRKDLEEDATFEFDAGEDAPMSLDAHPVDHFIVTGVNTSLENMSEGRNENCRIFKIESDKITLDKSTNTLSSKKQEDFQRVVRFSQDGTLVATGTTDGKVHVFQYPGFDLLTEPIIVSTEDEVLDVDFNLEKEKLTCCLRDGLKLINLRGKNIGQVVETISTNSIVKNEKTQFRAFRYGRGYTKDFGFAIANGITKPGSYVVKYDAYSFEQLKVVYIGAKPVTAVTLSHDGSILAFGTADLSITLMDAQTLKVLYKVKDAHSFPITAIAFSPDRLLLASASADSTCCIVSLPLQFDNLSTINPIYTVLLALAIAGILLLVLSVLDLDAYFEEKLALSKAVVTDVVASSTVDAIVPAIVTSIESIETIVETIISKAPIVTIIKDEF
ncbi:WD40-repeat-containing domain protein [Helicostylum pulchrum]|nr:WD40-repeat-containing domain protein [Helicostylum pulchrum]